MIVSENKSISNGYESGFIFSGMSMIIVLILSIILAWGVWNSSITLRVAGNYSISSQSRWSALSGIEVGKSKLESRNALFSGNYLFSGDTVSINLRTVDKNGNALPAALKRIESIAIVNDALAKMEILFINNSRGFRWPDTSIVENVIISNGGFRGIDSNNHPCINFEFSEDSRVVGVQALCYNLENVVVQYEDGTEEQIIIRNGDIASFEGRGKNKGKLIVGIWVKSGDNLSGDGPQYGEYIRNPNIELPSSFNIQGNASIVGQIYIGGDVSVTSTSIQDPVEIFVPEENTVSTNITENTSWTIHPNGVQTLPDLQEEIYDSLLAIANSIQITANNYLSRKLTLSRSVLDMTIFPTKTYFINGDLVLRGSSIITDASPDFPAMIIAAGNVIIEQVGRDQSIVPDNVIIIAGGSVTISGNSVFGTGVSSTDGRSFCNQLYGVLGVNVTGNTTVFGQLLSPGNIILENTSKTVGRIYAGTSFQIYNNSYFEGILMANCVESPSNTFESGTLKFAPYFPYNPVTSQNSYQLVPNSIKEF